MNNKGFAITSVIYGLSILGIMIVVILMGTLSSTRNNVSEEAKAVEDFLINFNQTEVTYRGSGTHLYKIPKGETGWYRFEAFGKGNSDAKGTYTTGIIFAEEGTIFTLDISDTATKVIDPNRNEIMVAPAAVGTKPGGDFKCYPSVVDGGDVNMETFTAPSVSYTGINTIALGTECVTAKIVGYPILTNTTITNQDYYFVDGLILAGASGSSEGKVIIQRLAEKDDIITQIPRKNHKFDQVTRINVSSDLEVAGIAYTYTYQNERNGPYYSNTIACPGASTCRIKNTSGSYVTSDLDEVTVYFNKDRVNAVNTTISLDTSSGTQVIYATKDDYGQVTTPNGIHLSAYQPDSLVPYVSGGTDLNYLSPTNNFAEHGNYYIIPITTHSKVVSGVSNATDDGNQLKIEPLTGESRQKWAIDMINYPGGAVPNFNNIPNVSGKKEYRLMELTRYKALNIYYDENYKLNFVSASETFNSLSRNEPQIWNIFPMGDGTYAIKTVVPSFSQFEKSGFLFAKPAGDGPNNINDIMIGLVKNQDAGDRDTLPTSAERFILYSLDFSS